MLRTFLSSDTVLGYRLEVNVKRVHRVGLGGVVADSKLDLGSGSDSWGVRGIVWALRCLGGRRVGLNSKSEPRDLSARWHLARGETDRSS